MKERQVKRCNMLTDKVTNTTKQLNELNTSINELNKKRKRKDRNKILEQLSKQKKKHLELTNDLEGIFKNIN